MAQVLVLPEYRYCCLVQPNGRFVYGAARMFFHTGKTNANPTQQGDWIFFTFTGIQQGGDNSNIFVFIPTIGN